MPYFLGQPALNADPSVGWEAPAGASFALDIRPAGAKPQLEANHWAIFKADSLPSEYELLGELDDNASGAVRSALASAVGGPVQGDTLEDLLWHILTEKGDPTGADICKPIMPTSKGYAELHIRGSVRRQNFNINDGSTHANRCLSVLQNDFNDIPHEVREKVLGGLCRKHKVSFQDSAKWEKFLPSVMRGSYQPKNPQTTYTDDFNRADSDTLGAQWTETGFGVSGNFRITSNAMTQDADSNTGYCRWEQDLSSSDNYAQCAVTTLNTAAGGTIALGPACRFQSGDTTMYVHMAVNSSTGSPNPCGRTQRVETGSVTTLDLRSAYSQSLPDTFRIEMDGSTLLSTIDGVTAYTTTDTNITTGLRGGFRGFVNNSNNTGDVVVDDFETGDLAAAVAPILAPRSGYKRHLLRR